MSDYTKLIFGDTSELYRPATLQEVGRPLQMTMQGLNPDTSYFAYAELYENGVKTAQSLQQTFQTIRAGVITLTHVSDVRSGSNYVVTYSVSNTYALSSSIMSINGSPIQGVISGNTITYTVSGLTMGQTYSYSISTIDFYGETDTTTGSLVTVAQNYITITYASKTSSSVTFDLDYVSDGGFYEGYIEYWYSSKDPSTDQADGHAYFSNGADTVTLNNLDEDTSYKFRASIMQTQGGTIIESNVVTQSTDAHDYSGDYFTIKNEYAGNNTVTFKAGTTGSSPVTTTFYVSKNGSSWSSKTDSSSGITVTLNQGEILMVRHSGTLGSYSSNYIKYWHTITCSQNFSVSGNAASLCHNNDFTGNKTMPVRALMSLFQNSTKLISARNLYLGDKLEQRSNCYENMFYGCSNLTQAPALPATTLATNCYKGMFCNCTSLTTAPALPATTLSEGCYNTMFSGCTSLTTAPALPATTLAAACYGYMFQRTSITTAPSLPVTTLANNCYSGMFNGCTSLTAAPSLPATTLADGCYQYMFYGCTSMAAAPSLPATTLAPYCYQYMFSDCTITSAPALPVTTLAEFCYAYMFNRCTALTTAPALPATSLPLGAYSNMFNGCTSLTTAPDLRHVTNVTTVENGYKTMVNMYYGCSNLTTAYAPTITWDATNKTTDWLYGVANSGTLFADPSIAASIPTSSTSGCPSGWSVGAVSDEFFNYFTIKNESENTNTISLWAESYLAERDVDISVDGGKTWTAYTAKRNPGQPVAQLSAGEEMLARHIGTIGDPHYISFRSSDKISAHGNVASLQFGDNFKKINQTISATQFNGLFIGSEYLIDASKLSFESYTATQGLGLYRAFEMCTSLIDPPDFSRIKSVNNDRSFYQTFYGCSSLTKVYAPSPSVWNSGNTYYNWLYGVAASGTIYANQTTAASIPTNSTSGCPTGWSISTT